MTSLVIKTDPVFDPGLAVLPILMATWETDPAQATIVYQNSILRSEIGLWKGRSILDLLNAVSAGEGQSKLETLISAGSIVFSGTLSGRDVKFHSRKSDKHFQMALSDNTEIIRARDREQRTALINSFLNIGSHELKTPLSGILGLTDLLLMTETDTEKLEYLDMVKASAKILNETVTKMLGMIYSENDIAPLKENSASVNISSFIQLMVPTFSKHLAGCDFSHQQLDLQATSHIDIPHQHLHDIFTEIAINLRRNTPAGKKVTVATWDAGDHVHIQITNECYGIPQADLEKIFEPFYRFQDPMKHSSGYDFGQGGIGMGLTIIKKYMDQAKGKVWFENSTKYAQQKESNVVMHLQFPISG